jgi:shikimate dehydrogenase
VELENRSILFLGAGGAARAIAFTLARVAKVAKLNLLDIDEKILNGLAADLRSGTSAAVEASVMEDSSLARAMAEADVIVHCTPVGMHPRVDASLVPKELFRSCQTVFDVVYTPLRTKLLADAEACGLKTVSGVEMFINQAALQFEYFTGEKAPLDVMRRVVLEKFS